MTIARLLGTVLVHKYYFLSTTIISMDCGGYLGKQECPAANGVVAIVQFGL